MDTEKKYREFPINILPPLLRNIVYETHKALNFPIAYIAMSLLTAIATAIGDTCWLKVKTGWMERPLFYVLRKILRKCGIKSSYQKIRGNND